MKIKTLLLVCLLPVSGLFGLFAQADTVTLTPFQASYKISTGRNTVGNASLSLNREKAYWLATLTTEPTGLFSLFSRDNTRETSLFTITPAETGKATQLTTLHYTSFQQKAKPGRNQNARFNPETGQIIITSDDKSETVIYHKTPVYDPLSSLFYIAQQLAGNDPTALEFPLFRRGAVVPTHVEFTQTATIETPMGRYTARCVIRKGKNSHRETHIWYAKALGFVPVKIEQFKKGELVAGLSLASLEE